MKKSTHDVEIIEVFARRGHNRDFLGGSKADREAWETMKKWDIEAAKFREFCQDRLSETDFNLVFGERSSWPECVDWFSVFKKRDLLLREFNELVGGDMND